MAVLIDVFLLLIIVISVIIFYKKGILRTLLVLVSLLISVAVGLFVATTFAAPVSERWIAPYMEDTIGQQVQSAGIDWDSHDSDTFLAQVDETLQRYGISVSDKLLQQVSSGADALRTQITGSVSQRIAYDILFVLSFLIAQLLLRLVIRALGLVDRIPILHGTNHLLGAFAGLVIGLVLAWGAALLIDAFSAFLSENLPQVFVPGFEQKTILYEMLLHLRTTLMLR